MQLMKLSAAMVILALTGCAGSGGDGGPDGGAGSDGGSGSGGATVCTLTISGPVTTGTYHQCVLHAGPNGGNQLEVSAFSLPGCNDCSVFWTFSQTPTDHCGGSAVLMDVTDPPSFPDDIGMEVSSSDPQASCTITTTQLDVAGGHWTGSVDAFLVAHDINLNPAGVAPVKLTGGF